jgi:hypothetical protein
MKEARVRSQKPDVGGQIRGRWKDEGGSSGTGNCKPGTGNSPRGRARVYGLRPRDLRYILPPA